MYVLPQEIEVWYIIPAIRKEFAKQLVRKHKLSYEKAGNILGISKAAISQYLSNKRANKLKLPDNIKKEISNSTKIITKEPTKTVFEIERIIKRIRKKKCSCEICKKYNPEIVKFCHKNKVC